MTNIPRAIAAQDLRRRPTEDALQYSSDLRDGRRPPGADVHGNGGQIIAVQNAMASFGDILNVNEVSTLIAILKHQRRSPGQEPG
jgi:hypothetical protein